MNERQRGLPMKKLLWLAMLVPVVAGAQMVETTVQWAAAQGGPSQQQAQQGWQAGFPDVTKVEEAHDRWPGGGRGHSHDSQGAPDNECNEEHHLMPDGDHDCDDPVGVPEPGTLGLAVLGLAGLGWVWLRRKQ